MYKWKNVLHVMCKDWTGKTTKYSVENYQLKQKTHM